MMMMKLFSSSNQNSSSFLLLSAILVNVVFFNINNVNVNAVPMPDMMMGLNAEEALDYMETKNYISHVQHEEIIRLLFKEQEGNEEEEGTHMLRQMRHEDADITSTTKLSSQTSIEINNYLDEQVVLGELQDSKRNLLKKRLNTFNDNGNNNNNEIEYLRSSTRTAIADYPPSTSGIPFMSRFHGISGEDYGFVGLWGFTTQSGERFVLQTTICGLYVLHVREMTTPLRTTYDLQQIQYIDLQLIEDGYTACRRTNLRPFNFRYRDVATHITEDTGDIYAYVGTQGYGMQGIKKNYVIDMSILKDWTPTGSNSNNNPIDVTTNIREIVSNDNKISNLDAGHTINVDDGYLFFHAYGGNNDDTPEGCHIYDIQSTPFEPKLLTVYDEGQCHDSFLLSGVTVPALGNNNPRDLLVSADGDNLVFTIIDITDVRTTNTYKIIGRTERVNSIFAHSVAISDDNRYMFAFEEDNVHDIAIYDLNDLWTNPTLNLNDETNPWQPPIITRFQWSGTNSMDTFVHNGWAKGNLLYVAHYEVGLRVFDFTDPLEIREVGYWETLRDPDGTGSMLRQFEFSQFTFEGCWNLFMFDDIDLLVVSDTYQGTFLLQDHGRNSDDGDGDDGSGSGGGGDQTGDSGEDEDENEDENVNNIPTGLVGACDDGHGFGQCAKQSDCVGYTADVKCCVSTLCVCSAPPQNQGMAGCVPDPPTDRRDLFSGSNLFPFEESSSAALSPTKEHTPNLRGI